MFGAELDNHRYSSLSVAAALSFDQLVGAVAACQATGALPTGDPLVVVRPFWALAHGLSALELEGAWPHGEGTEPVQALAEHGIAMLLQGAQDHWPRAAGGHPGVKEA